MKPLKLLHADYLDILFDNRNKTYGGYELRRSYPQRMRNALLFTLSAVLFLCAYAYINSHYAGNGRSVLVNTTTTHVTNVIFPPPPPKPISIVPPPPAPVQHIKTASFTPPVVVNDKLLRPDEHMHSQDELTHVQIGTRTADADLTPGSIGATTGTGTGIVATGSPSGAIKPLAYVQQMPELEGLTSYLAAHLQYPALAKESNIQGRVLIKFIVNEDGSISNAEVIRGIGGGCDEAALRVVNAMPRWKPGRQNGLAVKVYFMLPVYFKLE